MTIPCSFCRSTPRATFGQPDTLPSNFWLSERHFLSTASAAFLCGFSGEQHTENLVFPPPTPAPQWEESSTFVEGVEWKIHCSTLSPLQSDHFRIIQVYSFIHAKTQTHWLTLSAVPVSNSYVLGARDFRSHTCTGCSGRRNPPALEQQQLLPKPTRMGTHQEPAPRKG